MSERPRKRTKRDSVTNLYNQCKISGSCPDDVKNKVEQTTLADRLLKIFSSLVYFGGLGIGTGKGIGGSTGYRPLGGGGGRVTAGGTVIRPNVAVDPLGPADIVPIDSISPGTSSIVPLTEATPEIVPELEAGVINTGFDITTEPDIIEISSSSNTPAVSTIDDTAAVLEVQPSTTTPRRVATSKFTNPTYMTVVTESTITPEVSSTAGVFIDGASGGDVVGEIFHWTLLMSHWNLKS